MHSSDKAMKLYCVSFFFLHLQWLFIRQMNFSLSISWILKRFLTAQVLREKEYFAIKWTFMILRGKSIWQNHFHKQLEKYRWLTKCYLYSPWAIAEIWNWVAPEWLGKIRQQAEESRGHHQDSLHTQTFSWKGYISKDRLDDGNRKWKLIKHLSLSPYHDSSSCNYAHQEIGN